MTNPSQRASTNIRRIFFQGLLAILPISITLFVLYWLGAKAESLLGGILQAVLPDRWYRPGMGLAAGFVLIFVVGLLFNLWFVGGILRWAEHLMERIPLIKTLLGSIKDLLRFMSRDEKRGPRTVAIVTLPAGTRHIGIVTREDCAFLGPAVAAENCLAVYIPMSYQVAGYTIFLPRSAIQPISMSVEDAMRFCITAGMSGADSPPPPAGAPKI